MIIIMALAIWIALSLLLAPYVGAVIRRGTETVDRVPNGIRNAPADTTASARERVISIG
jgi:hypothetical protein